MHSLVDREEVVSACPRGLTDEEEQQEQLLQVPPLVQLLQRVKTQVLLPAWPEQQAQQAQERHWLLQRQEYWQQAPRSPLELLQLALELETLVLPAWLLLQPQVLGAAQGAQGLLAAGE